MDIPTYTRDRLRPQDLHGIRRRLATWNAEAEAHGLQPATITVEGYQDRIRLDDPTSPSTLFHRATVSAPVDHATEQGYTLLAMVQDVAGREVLDGDAALLLTRLAGTRDLDAYRDPAACVCVACGKRRRRKTVLILETPNGDTIPVGTDCAAQYLPRASNALVSVLEYLQRWRDTTPDEDAPGYWGRARATWDRDAVMMVTGWWLAHHPYEAGGDGTRVDVAAILAPDHHQPKGDQERERWRQAREAWEGATEDDRRKGRETGAAALAWLASEAAGGGDYIQNARAACRDLGVTEKGIGLVVSVVGVYLRAMDQERERGEKRRQKLPTVHVGTEGQRDTWTGTLLYARPYEGYFGVGVRYVWEVPVGDDRRALLVWWSSREIRDLEPGRVYHVTATVKRHEDYQGAAQTVINRARAVEV